MQHNYNGPCLESTNPKAWPVEPGHGRVAATQQSNTWSQPFPKRLRRPTAGDGRPESGDGRYHLRPGTAGNAGGGEPGIGKTRTAQELAGYPGTLGVQVLWGRSHGAVLPYESGTRLKLLASLSGIWEGYKRHWPAGEKNAESYGDNLRGPQEIGGLLVVSTDSCFKVRPCTSQTQTVGGEKANT